MYKALSDDRQYNNRHGGGTFEQTSKNGCYNNKWGGVHIPHWNNNLQFQFMRRY
jgi:hypothetical protein